MRRLSQRCTWGWNLVGLVILTTAMGAAPGKEALERAIQAKLTADTVDALGEVINLCQKSLDEGLEADDTKFARQLLASTLSQRGMLVSDAIFKPEQPDPQWMALRRLALADFERSLRQEPNQPKVQLVVAKLETLPGGNPAQAITAVDEAVRLSRDDDATRFEALVLRSTMRENVSDRIGDLTAAVEMRPRDPGPLRARGAIFMAADKPDKALADFDAALKLEPDHAASHEARGAILAALGQFDASRAAYARALELAPDLVSARLQRAQVNAVEKKYPAALEDLDALLKQDARHVSALLLRSQVHAAQAKPELALADLDAVLKLRPNFKTAWRLRAQLNASLGNIDRAVTDLEELLRHQPDDLETKFQLAVLERSRKQFPRALKLFDELVEALPDAWFVRFGRGDTYLSVGKHREARADYEAALKLQPKDNGLLNNFAWLLATSPDDEVRDGARAVTLATQACEQTEYKQSHVLSTLAAAYAEKGDFTAAEKWSRRAIELAEPANRVGLSSELSNYTAKKPWRELLHEDATVSQAPKKDQAR